MKLKALIQEWHGGKWGKTGQYIAIIEPEFFKNGKIKHSDFKVLEVVEVIKKGYGHPSANYSRSIKEVIEVIEE